MQQKKIIISTLIVVLLVGIIIFVVNKKPEEIEPQITLTEEVVELVLEEKVIGQSVEGRNIKVTEFGSGDKKLLFVGGVHGGYEWNSVLLAYQMIDFLRENPNSIPDNISVSIIPSLNPDGVFDVIRKEGKFSISDVPNSVEKVGQGRFNANSVDLNRNFDCKWQAKSSWRGNEVSAGSSPFSEPEAITLRNYIYKFNPTAAIFWHSQANTVYASECENGVLPETIDIMNLYAKSAQYNSVESFDAYPITGDVEGWLASIGIPAITVELETHKTIEFDRNLSGVKALFNYYKNNRITEISNEKLIVSNPLPNQIVSNPLYLQGEVRGNWLFEADAPVVLTDWDGRIIAESYIKAQENWMTEDFVPFTGTLEFEIPADIGDFSDKGKIIFQKANPSGLPENDDALEFQVNFR